jgi:hypothetical protein
VSPRHLPSFESLRRIRRWTWWDTRPSLTDAELTLFTIQARPACDALVTTGVHRQSLAYADEWFTTAYACMSDQMNQRLPAVGAEPPVWLWARLPWRELAHEARRKTDDERVLLEVRVPREQALLSHFDDWHRVLNRGLHVPPLPHELADSDAWWTRAESLTDDFDRRVDDAGVSATRDLDALPDAVRRELETSWTRIFDPATWAPRSAIQAAVHELRAHQVVRALRCRATTGVKFPATA